MSVFFTLTILLTGIIPTFPQQPDENYMAGCAGLIKGEYAKAVESFSYAIVHNNSDERFFMKRGEALLKLNEIARARDDFNEANLISPGVADLYLARSYSLSGDKEKALFFLTNHLKSEFRLPEDSVKKDPAFAGLRDTDEWDSFWSNEWYSAEDKYFTEVAYYNRRKQYDDAISYLDAGLLKYPQSRLLLTLRADMFQKTGNYAASIADYTTVLAMDKKTAGINYTTRGLVYLKAGKYKDAINDLNKALKDDPGMFILYIQRAKAFAGLMTWESAIADIVLYLNYFNNDLQAVFLCGNFYFESGDYINALKCYNRNLKEDPNNSLYYKARGKTYLKTLTYRYSVNDLSMSLDLNPDDSETWMYLGIAKIKSGDTENGCSDLEKSRKLGNTEALKYIIDNCQ